MGEDSHAGDSLIAGISICDASCLKCSEEEDALELVIYH